MSNKLQTQNSKPATAAATPAAFDEKAAQLVAATRHEPTGRTFMFVQGDDLFSATRDFVATDAKAAQAAVLAAKKSAEPAKPAQ